LYSAKHAGKHVDTSGFIGGDHELTAGRGFELVEGVLGLAPQVHHLLGILGEKLTGGGERNPAAEAFKELSFQLVFELSDLRADGGLRAVARLRSLRKSFFRRTISRNVCIWSKSIVRPGQPGAIFSDRTPRPNESMYRLTAFLSDPRVAFVSLSG